MKMKYICGNCNEIVDEKDAVMNENNVVLHTWCVHSYYHSPTGMSVTSCVE